MSHSLCQYQNILGKPYEGFHAQRIGPFALWDIVGTIMISLIIVYFWKGKSYSFGTKLGISLLGTFAVAELLHYIFCVPTAFMKMI